ILASARSSVSCTRSSARSPLPESEMAKARRLGTDAKMSSRRASVRGITPSRLFLDRPLHPLGDRAWEHQASGSARRTGPAPPGARHRRTWPGGGGAVVGEFFVGRV